MIKDIDIEGKASKALAEHCERNGLIPRLRVGDDIMLMKTEDGYVPMIKLIRA